MVKTQHDGAMPHASANGIELCYDTLGDPSDPTMLLVCGLGGQLIEWEREFCQLLVDRGFHVVRFDNRDVGLSTHLEGDADVLGLLASIGSDTAPDVPYLLTDMAADAVALLDHLGVDRAHVVGVSMGGMIAQQIAISHPDHVATLTSIMSTTGEPDVGQPTAVAMQALLAPPATSADEAADGRVRHAHIWGSPGLFDEDRLRRAATEAWDRDHDASGPARQIAAILASPSRVEGLASLDLPTLVIHGTDDTLIQPSGGERTAAVVPGAALMMIEGMGHDLPVQLWDGVVDAICTHATTRPVSA
jgi:pimeloyl-ACP methyl ester carboxylesterase